MGILLHLFERSLVQRSDLAARADLTMVTDPVEVAAIVARYQIHATPSALYVHKKHGHLVAVWASFFEDPAADRAPYVRLVPQRGHVQRARA